MVSIKSYLFSLDFKGIQIKTLTYHLSFLILEKILKYLMSAAWQDRSKLNYTWGYRLVQDLGETGILYQKPYLSSFIQ